VFSKGSVLKVLHRYVSSNMIEYATTMGMVYGQQSLCCQCITRENALCAQSYVLRLAYDVDETPDVLRTYVEGGENVILRT